MVLIFEVVKVNYVLLGYVFFFEMLSCVVSLVVKKFVSKI